MNDAGAVHTPVMLTRCLDLLAPAITDDAVVVDATLGLGGHTDAMLAQWPALTVVGIDRDPHALAIATARLQRHGERLRTFHGEYDRLDEALASVGADRAHGILMDLGISSMQIDLPERGFSYATDAPLDMRMNPQDSTTAADLLASASVPELTHILSTYGEERFAGRIARAIERTRGQRPVTRSSELVEIVRAAVPAAARTRGGNPAKRTFQALRIAVNRELDILERALAVAIESMAVGGRLVVMSYHSLEDRIVKQAFARGSEHRGPRGLPVVLDQDLPYLRPLTRGAEKATIHEATANPRSRSVRLRAVERVREVAA